MGSTTRLYQAVLRDGARPIWVRLHRTFSRWGEEKGFPAADAARQRTRHEVGGARLTMERRDECGRYVLEEPCDGGALRTEAVFLDGTDRVPGWVVVTVERSGGGHSGTAHAPGFLPAYLRTHRITDGAVHLEDAPVVLAEQEVSHFVHILTEPRRRVPIAVVTPDPGSAGRAEWLAAAVAGAGVVVRLADKPTEDLFNQAIGRDLGVYGGAIRTYAAPFDPATERHSYRHPPMRPAKLREEGEAALGKIVEGMIGRSAGADLPEEVRRALPVVHRVLVGRSPSGDLAGALDPRLAPSGPAREALRRRLMPPPARPGPAGAPFPPSPGSAATPLPRPGAAPIPGAVPVPGVAPAPGPGGTPVPGPGAVPAPRRPVVPLPPSAPGASPAHAAGQAPTAGRAGEATGPDESGEPAADASGEAAAGGSGKAADAGGEAGADRRADEGVRAEMNAPGEAPPGLAYEVAELVVKEVREELETALGLAAGMDTGQRLLREVRTLGLRLDALRDLVIDDPAPSDEPEDPRVAYRLLQEEYADAVDSARTLAERVRWLEGALAALGHPMYGVAVPEEVFQPGSLAEALVEARSRLTHVVIGDTDSPAARLDVVYPGLRRSWAGKAWDALHALNDFARARSTGEFAGGFYDWCAVGEPGRYRVPTGMLVMRESKSVTSRDKFRDPRTFPVPTEVDPRGEILMEAHIKLRAVGYPAPRMHFHDDSGGATGKVYVGYLGAHLPNTRTN
ncbi:hypothetical protein ABZT47_01205 [Sphaerisporangium sp. NPDC005289]|uniref:hypothetical protein n=1 Tax=Sphaerisporangium sp. NPDC005289 TaxID=3155247 RepID=UPI0033A892A6